MMLRRSLAVFHMLGLTLGLPSTAALAAPPDPPAVAQPAAAPAAKHGPGTQAVKAANDTIASLLKRKVAAGSKEEKELAAKVTTSVRGFLDIDQLGKRAMADNWQKLSQAQQDQFLALLRALIEENYVRGLRANLEYQVAYLGEAAGAGGKPGMTGTLTLRYRRGTPLGDLHVEAHIDRADGIKTYAVGHIADAEGVTVEAEGVFILPKWARKAVAERADAPTRFE
jgi:hypothetical protein